METSNFPDLGRKRNGPFSLLGKKITEWHIRGKFKEDLEFSALVSELLKARKEENYDEARAYITERTPAIVLKRAEDLANKVVVN